MTDADGGRLPVMTVISGPPASGKSTIATQVAARVGIPVVSRDAVKFSLILTGRRSDEDLRRGGPVSKRTFALFEALIRVHLEGGASLIVEQACERGKSEDFLAMFEPMARIQMVYCSVSRATSIDRFSHRIGASHRPNPTDDEILAGLKSGAIDHDMFGPLDAEHPSVSVDCECDRPECWERIQDEVATFVRRSLADEITIDGDGEHH